MGKIVVLGASPLSSRISHLAVRELHRRHFEVVAIGSRTGSIGEIPVLTGQPEIMDVDSLLLYINPVRQQCLYTYILSLNPRRIIFNPGTENPELAGMARDRQIRVVEGCSLVMLEEGSF